MRSQGRSLAQSNLGELRRAIEKEIEYPAVAKARKQIGKIEVEFTLTKSGEITQAHLKKGCDFEKLNEAALHTVCRLQKFKPLPDDICKADFRLMIPIDLKLE